MFLGFYKVIFFPKLIFNPSKLSIPDLACNIPIKHNHRSICKSVQSFQPVIVNVNVVSVPLCHRFHVVKPAFRNQHVTSLTKPLFITDTLNTCTVVKYVSSTHDTRKFFPSTHNSISIPIHISCLENDNIANCHLLLTNC